MAATVVVSEKFSTGNLRCVIGTITLDSSYPENGYPITAASISDGYLQDLKFLDIARYSVGFTPFWNESLSTIEVSDITGIPDHTHTITAAAGTLEDAIGFESAALVSTSGGTITTASTSAASVTAQTGKDLSSVVVTFMAYGR